MNKLHEQALLRKPPFGGFFMGRPISGGQGRIFNVDETVEAPGRWVREKAAARLEGVARDMGEVRASLRAIITNIEWIVRQSGKGARTPP